MSEKISNFVIFVTTADENLIFQNGGFFKIANFFIGKLTFLHISADFVTRYLS